LEYFVLLHLAQKFEPDMVVVMTNFTDVTDDWQYTKRGRLLAAKNGETLGVDGREDKGFLYRVAEQSALMRMIVQKWKLYRRMHQPDDLTESYGAMFKPSYSQKDYEAWEISKFYLGKIKEWADDKRIPFLLVLIPAGTQLEAVSSFKRPDLRFMADGKITTSTKMQDMLHEWSRQSKADFLDLLPYARKVKSDNPSKQLFYPLDQHFTESGNEMAAQAIFDFLKTHLEIQYLLN
jgi:hypothetical protein